MAINLGKLVLGIVGTNCYYIYNESARQAIVVDPGDDGIKIYTHLKERGVEVGAILLTHGHFDHIIGVMELKRISGALVYSSAEEVELLSDPLLNCSNDIGNSTRVVPDEVLNDGEEKTLCELDFKCILTPGHTSGSMCYYFDKEKLLFAGDTLFAGSVGRTDLPTGSFGAIIRSIREKLMVLEDDVNVYPGHGDATTIGEERRYNPFL